MGVKQRGTCEGCARIAVAGQYGNRRKKEQKTRSCCSAANGMWVLVMVVLRPWPLLPLWSNILWARLSMGTWNRPPQRIKRWKQLKTCSPKSSIQWVLPKLNVCILMSLVIIPSSSTSPISIFQSGWPRKEIGVGSEYVLGRDFCCCCCDWPLEKMKPLADKLGVVGRVEWDCTRTHWAYIGRKPAEPIAQHSFFEWAVNIYCIAFMDLQRGYQFLLRVIRMTCEL